MGKRNYHYFFLFLCTLNLTQIFVGLFSIVHISVKIAFDVKEFKENNLHIGKEIQISFCNVIISIWLICFVAITMIFTTGLLIFHIKILKVDTTTREELKKLFLNPFLNPFQRSTKENLKNILFPNISKKSLIDELKENKNDYIEYINEINEKNKEQKNTDVTKTNDKENSIDNDKTNINNENIEENDINIIIDNDIISNNIKKENNNKNEEKTTINKKSNKKQNEIRGSIKRDNESKKKNQKKFEKDILDKITTNEDKSSSNDIMTNHTINKDEENEKREKNSYDSPIKNKNYNMQHVHILESQSYLPPSSKKYLNKDELNSINNNSKEKKKHFPKRNNK